MGASSSAHGEDPNCCTFYNSDYPCSSTACLFSSQLARYASEFSCYLHDLGRRRLSASAVETSPRASAPPVLAAPLQAQFSAPNPTSSGASKPHPDPASSAPPRRPSSPPPKLPPEFPRSPLPRAYQRGGRDEAGSATAGMRRG